MEMCFQVASVWFPEEFDVDYKAISSTVSSNGIYFLSEFGPLA